MSLLRKLVVFLAASGLTFLIYMAVVTSIFVLAVTPENVKQWLRSSNVYSTVVDDLVKKSQDAVDENTDSQNTPANEQAQIAVKKAFTPEFLQTSTEQFIDGLVPWLEGEASKPTFNIDISGAKQAFIDSFAEQARIRYAGLPVCTPGQAVNTSDPMNIPCQVPGYSIDAEIQKAREELANSEKFLPNTILTADTFKSGEGTEKKPTFEKLNQVPKAYQWIQRSPIIFGVLALGAAAIVIFLSQARRKGIRRVLASLVIVCVPLLIMLWAIRYGVEKAEAEIMKSASQNNGLESTGISLLKEVQRTLSAYTLVFVVGLLLVAAGLAIYLIATKSKKPSAADTDAPKTPQESADKKQSKSEAPASAHSEKPKPGKPKTPKLIQ